MLALAIRTDAPQSELYLYQDDMELSHVFWEAHRELSDTILQQIDILLDAHQITLQQLTRIIVFEGPGSFTGLRIGHSVANALAYGLGISVVSTKGEYWLHDGLAMPGNSFVPVAPFYGADAHITQQKK